MKRRSKKEEENTSSGGINFMGPVHAPGGQFAGRDIINEVSGIAWQEVESLFTPLMDAIQQAPAEQQAQAEATTDEIKNEVAKGDKANDARLSDLLDKLVALVPGAASAIASMFAQPILVGIAGPLTKAILARLGLQ